MHNPRKTACCIRRVFLFCALACVSGLYGCVFTAPNDFSAIFSMVHTAEEALEAFQPPNEMRLQDDMTVYSWDGRKEELVPAHYRFVRRSSPGWSGFYEYDQIWFPDSVHILRCSARIIADPEGVVVYRDWRGNACQSFIKQFPAWYDRGNPDARRDLPQGARAFPGGADSTNAKGDAP